MQRTLAFIRRHSDAALSLRLLAKMAAMSRSEFSLMVRRLTGRSLRHYLEDLRLQHACELLLSGSRRPIDEIAFDAGFTDPTDFQHIFRKRFGVSPTQFARTTRAARPAS